MDPHGIWFFRQINLFQKGIQKIQPILGWWVKLYRSPDLPTTITWIYQLNPNSLFWLLDVCRNHHINVPKRCSPRVLLDLAPPVSRQVLGAVVQDSQNLTKKKRGSSWHCSSSQFFLRSLIHINVLLTSERCEYDTMYLHSTELLAVVYENRPTLTPPPLTI